MMRRRECKIFWDTKNLRRGKQDGNPGGMDAKYQNRTVRWNRIGGILDSAPRFIALAFESVVSSFIRGLDWNKAGIRRRVAPRLSRCDAGCLNRALSYGGSDLLGDSSQSGF
jgi:hypothetical protein